MRTTGLICRYYTPNRKVSVLAAALLSSLLVIYPPLPAAAQAAPQAAPQAQTWQLPAGPLDVALSRMAAQARLTISYSPELVAGRTTRGVSGHHTPAEALQRLLAGTGLALESVDDTTFALRLTHDSKGVSPATRNQSPERTQEPALDKPVQEMERVSVTGTRIRGVQPSSPLLVISQEEMRLSGHNDLGEVVRALPQNFSGGQNPGVTLGAGGPTANQNITGASSLNLRGLGPDATLTLLNGTRLPYDGFSQATDVAVIPTAAIDRFEVLLDGASAIYGSDAVGGVANIVLKRDYDGAEITARYGEATSGGYEQSQISAVVGQAWSTGSVLVAAETANSGNVLASQRDYLNYIAHSDRISIYPKTSQDGLLISGYQKLGTRVELALDTFYTQRSMEVLALQTPIAIKFNADTTVYGLSPSVKVSLPRDWTMRAHGFVGEDEAETPNFANHVDTGVEVSRGGTVYRNRAEAVGLEFEGVMMALPGGDGRISFGADLRKAEYTTGNLLTGTTAIDGSNQNHSLYGELNLPLIGETQRLPFARHLSVNGAFRYDHYDRFGGAKTPKVGLLWGITPSLDVRASWGKSFKAPRVTEQFQATSIVLRNAAAAGISNAPPSATVLTEHGGNPDLGPETAKVITAGLLVRPSFMPGASFEIGWFDIDYKDRVVNPISAPLAQYGQLINNPTYERFFIVNPTQSDIEEALRSSVTFSNSAGVPFDPNNVAFISKNRFVNVSSQRVRGLDFDARYTVPLRNSILRLSAGSSWISHSQRRVTEGTPTLETAGVEGFPPKLKGRLGAQWSNESFSAGGIVNYLGGVRETRSQFNVKRDSMVTLDLVLDYAARPKSFGGIGFNLSVMNAFNERPPFITPPLPFYVSYDSTNYSALGRTVSLSVTKKF